VTHQAPQTVTQRYRTIVADPPWDYGTDAKRGVPGRYALRTVIPYEAMSENEIAALPVARMAHRRARLFLWATNRHLPAALRIMDAWGFKYAQTLVWHKTGNLSPLGGSVAPNHAEFLLVGRRGNVGLIGRWPTSVIAAPKPVYEHSRKPDVFLDLVERVSPGPYVEMFARRARFGWDYWGDQSLGTATMEAA
jgi:N6-adenosine-specific RNA methylase IME4